MLTYVFLTRDLKIETLTNKFVPDPYPVSKLWRRYDETVDKRHNSCLVIRRFLALGQSPLQLTNNDL